METEKPLSTQESLQIIGQMIHAVKHEMQDDSFYYLLWGWLVFIASLTQYFLMQMSFNMPWLAWAALMPLGAVASAIYGRKQEKQRRVKTHLDEFLKYALIAFLISLLIVLFFQQKLQLNCYPMVMLVYGIWLFISGGGIQFRPLIIGGVINWIFAVAAFFVPFEIQLLLLAGAVLLGYIIPGYMLKAKFKSLKPQTGDQRSEEESYNKR